MPVFVGSRYAEVKYTGILGTDGKVRRFLHARTPLTLANVQQPVIVHPMAYGEDLDELAWKAAGKPRLWWVIADVSDVLFPLDIPPGTPISVPTQELVNRIEVG